MTHGLFLAAGLAVLAGFLPSPGEGFHRQETEAKTYKVKAIKNISYYDAADRDKAKHALDLYLPEGAKNFPVLFFVHGGAWQIGDRGDFFGLLYGGLAKHYAKQGIGVVVISYRLSPKVKHPEHVKDVARAFAWTHKTIAKHGGNKDQIFVAGHSAGAHLISLLVTDERYLKAHDLSAKNLQGAIPISGVYNVPERFLPNVFGTGAGAGKLASPITYVRKSLPPFLILYADGDLPGCGKVPSEAFAKALKDKGNKVKTVEFAQSNHYNILFDAGKPDTPVSAAIIAFIRDPAGK